MLMVKVPNDVSDKVVTAQVVGMDIMIIIYVFLRDEHPFFLFDSRH